MGNGSREPGPSNLSLSLSGQLESPLCTWTVIKSHLELCCRFLCVSLVCLCREVIVVCDFVCPSDESTRFIVWAHEARVICSVRCFSDVTGCITDGIDTHQNQEHLLQKQLGLFVSIAFLYRKTLAYFSV